MSYDSFYAVSIDTECRCRYSAIKWLLPPTGHVMRYVYVYVRVRIPCAMIDVGVVSRIHTVEDAWTVKT